MLSRCGFQCKMPGGTYFLYAPPAASPTAALAAAHRLRERRSRQPVSHHRALDLHRPLGRRRAVPAFSATYEAADERAEDALMAETEARLKNIRPVF